MSYVYGNCRYLQGARLFGNSNESIDSALPIASVEPSSEVAVINDMSTSTSTTTTLRARFVGQGYKQVKPQLSEQYKQLLPVKINLSLSFESSIQFL